MISRLTPPTQLTFLASVALAIIAVVARVLGYMGIQMPMFPTGGFVLLLIGYLILLAGNLFEGV
jgi:preprotein translocase subunit SecY